MSVDLREEGGGKILVAKLTGKLTKQDYEGFVPEVERLTRQHGQINVLVEMNDFHGWTMGALWENIKFDPKRFTRIERLALVGDRKWEAGMVMFCHPFTMAAVRYFDAVKSDEASTWINAGIAPSV